jgi:catechol 2,3-dioxygenase-like lactoylglutathione lyase family enzyme
MATVSVRYIVDDVDAAIAFYCQQLGFHEEMHPAPTFAMLSRGDLRLVLSAPGGGPGGRPGHARRQPARARRLEPVPARGRHDHRLVGPSRAPTGRGVANRALISAVGPVQLAYH